ncbi:MAG TPA: hypothetical protein ENI53_00015 [Thermoplasmatales archaeon]|nr:hypothetical protein [Thermoplasmatales archaeon]
MSKSVSHKEMVRNIKKILKPVFTHIYVENEKNTGKIQVFNIRELPEKGKNQYKIAEADILVYDKEKKLFLIIEPETNSSPKTFGRSLNVYTIAESIKTREGEQKIKTAILLLIVIPNKKESNKKANQLKFLEKRLKESINLKNSRLKDFAFCQIKDFKNVLKNLLKRNGYESYANLLI